MIIYRIINKYYAIICMYRSWPRLWEKIKKRWDKAVNKIIEKKCFSQLPFCWPCSCQSWFSISENWYSGVQKDFLPGPMQFQALSGLFEEKYFAITVLIIMYSSGGRLIKQKILIIKPTDNKTSKYILVQSRDCLRHWATIELTYNNCIFTVPRS